MTLSGLLMDLAERARILRNPAPVIETDMVSAIVLADALQRELPGFRWVPDGNVIAMLDGVKIVARHSNICKREVDGWRDHFGALADIWSD